MKIRIIPVFVVEVAIVELPQKLLQFLLHGLTGLTLPIIIYIPEVVRVEHSSIVKALHLKIESN